MPCSRRFMGHVCGQCKSCRIVRKQVWVNRLQEEAKDHGVHSCMITLTYDRRSLPDEDGKRYFGHDWYKDRRGGLSVRDVQLWQKRFRKFMEPKKVRLFSVGEYGEDDCRPHYHILVFGAPMTPDIHGVATVTWKLGKVDMGYTPVIQAAAQYVSGYVLKKASDDPRTVGLPPPFRIGSQGIGRSAIERYISMLEAPHVYESWAPGGDVPNVIRRGRKTIPLGRYYVTALRRYFGVEESYKTSKKFVSQQEKMRAVWETLSPSQKSRASKVGPVMARDEQKIVNQEALQRLLKQKRSL